MGCRHWRYVPAVKVDLPALEPATIINKSRAVSFILAALFFSGKNIHHIDLFVMNSAISTRASLAGFRSKSLTASIAAVTYSRERCRA